MGVDVARALALLGMMSVHILPQLDPDGRVTTAFVVASGRSSALFALLAGTGLALLTGGSEPRLKPYRDIAAGVLTRAVLLAGIGLSLGELMPPVIVILTNYGLLFVVALAVLALPAKALMALAGAWVVTTPLLSHVLRADLPAGQGEQPSLSGLLQPIDTLRALTLTGYYPILQWSAYLFVGIAVGRLTLGRVRTAAWLTATGLALAFASRIASDQLLLRGGLAELRAAGPTELVPQGSTTDAVSQLQVLTMHGLPTTTWWWQAVASPHTVTPLSMAHAIGSGLAVLGAALLLVHAVERARGLAVLRGLVRMLAATGSMTLTLYTVHVLALELRVGPTSRSDLLLAHVVLAVVLATLWRSFNARGPLEQLVADVAAVSRPTRHPT